jgi:hypothetical protein
MAVTIAPYFPCLDDRHRYTPDLCASCPRELCWNGQPVRREPGRPAIPPKMHTQLLPRRSDLASSCATCANVGNVTPPGDARATRTPIVWCEAWHWQAPITEYELAYGQIPAKAGALAPCPDHQPAAQLRPAVEAEREAHRQRERRRRQLLKLQRQQPPELAAVAA